MNQQPINQLFHVSKVKIQQKQQSNSISDQNNTLIKKYIQIYSLCHNISSKSSLIIIIICLSSFICISECVSSVPRAYDNFPNIQTTIQQLSSVSSAINPNFNYNTYNYVYTKSKRSQPLQKWVFIAIYQMDYDTTLRYSFSGYLLNYHINYTLKGTSGVDLHLYYYQNFVTQIKVSLLIIDNDFPYRDIFQSYIFSRSYTNLNEINFTLSQSTYSVLPFITYFSYQTSSHSDNTIGINWSTGVNSLVYSMIVNFNGNYIFGYIKINILVVYPAIAKVKYQILIQSYTHHQTTSPFQYSTGFTKYMASKSVYFMGLARFEFVVPSSSSSTGSTRSGGSTDTFTWAVREYSNSTDPMVIQVTPNSRFQRIQFSYIMINRIYCPYPYTFLGTNQSSSTPATECFDMCLENQYIEYNSTTKTLNCTNCPNILCKTCQSSTKCSSCIDGYKLVQNTFACALDNHYYVDGSGNIQACHSLATGCETCTTSISCSGCIVGFYLSGTICNSCSNVAQSCSNCTSSACLGCTAPKVLINSTFCSDPIDPQPLPNPNNSLNEDCQDLNCLQCSPTNLSICNACKSSLYKIENHKCITVCGDGLIDGSDVCDDENTIDFDGCSADCKKLEQNFICNKIPALVVGFYKSQCYFSKEINLDILSIQKSEQQNKVNLYFKNSQPKIAAWQQIENNNQLTKSFSLKIPRFDSDVSGYFFNYTASFVKSTEQIKKLKLRSKIYPQEFYSQTRKLQSTFSPDLYEYILVEISYSEDAPGSVSQQNIKKESLNHQRMSLTFDPTLSQRKIFTKSPSPLQFNSEFTLKADDNQVIQYHNADYYKMANQINLLAIVVSILCLILLVIGFVSFCIDGRNSRQMLIALQTSFIVQLTYFSLLGVGEINPLFMSMAAGLKLSSGYDLILGGQLTSYRQLLGIGIESPEMSSNVNVSFILVIMCMAIGGIMLLLDKFIFFKNVNKNVDENHEKIIDQNIKDNQQNTEHQQSKCCKWGMFLIFSFGFGLLLLFLYKFVFFILVQIRCGQNLFGGLNIIILLGVMVISIFYLIFLFRKVNSFNLITLKLTENKFNFNIVDILNRHKIIQGNRIKNIQQRFLKYIQTLPQDQKPQTIKSINIQGPKINIKLWYFIVIIIQHLLNIIIIVFLSQSFTYNRILSIVLYIGCFIFIYKYEIYSKTNLYRLYFTYFTGIMIQILLLIRSIMISESSQQSLIGKVQTSLGIYFPFTMIIALFLLCIIAIIYSVYSIKKIRCCNLQMDWQKIGLNNVMKNQLQSLIFQQINGKTKQKQSNNQSSIKKQLQFQSNDIINQKLLNDKLQCLSFNSKDQTPFFGIPINIRKQANGIMKMTNKPNFRNHRLKNNLSLNNQIDFDQPINMQITTKDIKRQIKQKLLTSKLDKKIKSMQSTKFQYIQFPQSKIPVVKNNQNKCQQNQNICQKDKNLQPKQENQQKNQQNNINEIQIKQIQQQRNLSQINIQQKSTLQVPLIKQKRSKPKQSSIQIDLLKDKLGYLYTDSKMYNLYEEFDMI